MSTKNKKLYIFDIDGTLTDTFKVDDKCFIRTFVRYFGVELTDIDFSQFQNVTDWGITEELVLQTKGRAVTSEEIDEFRAAFIQDLREEASADKTQFLEIKGAGHFIQTLKERTDIEIAMATGAWSASAIIKLQNAGIPFHGIPLSNSDDHKTREAITLDAIQKSTAFYGYDFTDVTYFGDGSWDFKTCKNLSIPFIGMDFHNNGKLKTLGAERVLTDWEIFEK